MLKVPKWYINLLRGDIYLTIQVLDEDLRNMPQDSSSYDEGVRRKNLTSHEKVFKGTKASSSLFLLFVYS